MTLRVAAASLSQNCRKSVLSSIILLLALTHAAEWHLKKIDTIKRRKDESQWDHCEMLNGWHSAFSIFRALCAELADRAGLGLVRHRLVHDLPVVGASGRKRRERICGGGIWRDRDVARHQRRIGRGTEVHVRLVGPVAWLPRQLHARERLLRAL